MAEYKDLIIVGAGWQGIAAAKIYRDLYPDGDFLVLDANSSIGGVWAAENFYPALRTQGPFGSFEYTFYPLTTEEFGVRPGEHIPGKVIQRYLQRVAENFDLTSRFRFGVKVVSAEPDASGGWLLQMESLTGVHAVFCAKLIVATGVTSIPRIPEIPGSKEFKGPVISYKELADTEKSTFMKDSSVETVAVLGGTKSGHDAVYWNAIAGKNVHWVVQRSGHGVAWMAAPKSTRFLGQQVQVEVMATTRLFSLFSPCVWGEADGLRWPRWFLHQTRLGRLITRLFWRVLGASVLASTGLRLHKETEKANPDFDFQWQASSAGTLNYSGDFYSLLRSGQVSIHRKNLTKLTREKMHFSDGSHLEPDAVVYCTGWKWTPPLRFNSISTLELGIPTKMDSSKDVQEWKAQCRGADGRVLEEFPYLRLAPSGPSRSASNEFGADEDGEPYTSWCLHRAIAPPSQVSDKATRNLAFLGLFSTLPTAALCEIQALWAIAFLHGRTKTPRTVAEAREEATLWTRWDRLRYPFSHASKYMDTSFDIIPYFDVLLSDMQLEPRRKASWWKELTEPYGAADYKTLVKEFEDRNG